MTTLTVSFCGDAEQLEVGDTLTFGRQADLVIDQNPHLHRLLGRFSERGGQWFIANLGRAIDLELDDRETRSRATIAPGSELALTYRSAILRFSAGKADYEIEVDVDFGGERIVETAPMSDTVTLADLPLTPDQRRLIVALAEPTLNAGGQVELPSNRQAAVRLGWKITRFNRKLDNVCEKLDRAGVPGLRAGAGMLSADRRHSLVTHAVRSGLVTVEHLALLDTTAE